MSGLARNCQQGRAELIVRICAQVMEYLYYISTFIPLMFLSRSKPISEKESNCTCPATQGEEDAVHTIEEKVF